MQFLFACRDYRGLAGYVDFKPDGVCVLVGANGSGKSTLLSALEFLKNLFQRTTQSAVALDGGHWGLVNFKATDKPLLLVNLADQQWDLELSPDSFGSYSLYEHIRNGSEELLDLAVSNVSRMSYHGTELTRGEGSFFKLAWDLHQDTAIADLVNFIQNIRTYRHYRLSQLRDHGSRADSGLRLTREGENLFTVLRNWRDQRAFRPSYDFVIESLRAAFPDFFEDFEFYGDAQTVRTKVYLKGIPEAMPVSLIPDGLLVAMLHLAAIGGSPSRSFVAIDDFENYLHPFAIRSLIESIRGIAALRDLCVLIATHSPVVLDEFRTEPERVFVMDFETPNKPIQLNHLRDPEWLSHFSLGDLYSKLEFGARLPRAEASETGDSTMRNGT
ncbi:MAG: ATP-binding protein [Planctomycetes bacterium]|nr:ATP-binding protein [Planctomycetota bacterium]